MEQQEIKCVYSGTLHNGLFRGLKTTHLTVWLCNRNILEAAELI